MMLSFKQFIGEAVGATLVHKIDGDEQEIGANFHDYNHKRQDKVRRIPMSMITSRYEGDDKAEKSPDNKESRGHIDQMSTHLRRGGSLPPILVRRHPSTSGYQVIDGHHRYFAHKEAGKKYINVSVLPAGRIKGDRY